MTEADDKHAALRARLVEAIDGGELLLIRYEGGSRPGTVRQIRPMGVDGDYLRAREDESAAAKTYRLDKIDIVDIDTPVDDVRPTSFPEDIDALVEIYGAALSENGWIIDAAAQGRLALYGVFANGKRRKTPHIEIDYAPESIRYGVTEEGGVEAISMGPSARPWTLRVKGQNGISFARLSRLLPRFFAAAGIDQRFARAPR